MNKIKLVALGFTFIFLTQYSKAQTFNGTGGAIPDNGAAPTYFPVTVSGVGTITSSYGLASVCINITHTWDSDLEIKLVAPDGTIIPLSIQRGGSGANYNGTCFLGTATTAIGSGTAPFAGNYRPDGSLGAANNGQNANGIWKLSVQDVFSGFTGTLNSWSLSFSSTPSPPPAVIPACIGNPPPGNDCSTATPVCNFNGYCGNTSSTYTINTWTQLTNAFCGSLDNNSFVTFVASATTASFNVWVTSSASGFGIQMFVYSGGCGSGAVTSYGCDNQINPSPNPTVFSATGLTIGNTYYLMFDGYAGDVCNYTIAPISGVSVLAVNPSAPTICPGGSVSLTASGGQSSYTWSGGAGLNTTNGATVIASPATTTTYTVTSLDPAGTCPLTKDVTVTVSNAVAPPSVTSTVNYCQGSTAAPLTATGTALLWYTTATGGTSSATAPIPSTATTGSTIYYVTQTLTCGESPRVPVTVNVNGTPAPTVVTPVNYCQGNTASALTATGTGLLWYSAATGGTGSATAPIPTTTTLGSTTYYVSQTVATCESPRTPIVVTINNTTPPPVVTSPVTYCLGATASALTATGTGLQWYAAATGGSGSATAPIPSTAAAGNISYYVSQTNVSCGESPRVPIVVTTYPIPSAPTVGADPVYCVNSGTPAATLTATGSNLLWYTTSIGGTGSISAPTPTINTVGNIPYYVSQTINSCESPRAVINVNTVPAPSLGSDQIDTVCYGESIDLTTYYNTTGLVSHWYNNGIEVIDPTNITTSGTYELQVFLGDCSDTAFLYFNVRPPVIANAGNDTIAIRGMEHQLFATGGDTYSWAPSSPLNFSNIPNPLATLNDDQLFVVTAFNSIGCFDKDSVFIKVYEGPTYYIPNAFSPDGDGLNDVFRPIPVGIVNTEYFRVYNRLGKLIYNSSRWLRGWDGTFQGRKQPVGNYVWVIKGTDRNGKVIEMKGNVLLLK